MSRNDSLKEQVKNILGSTIIFNKTFDKETSKFKEGMKKDFLDWCKTCQEGKALGSVPPKKGFRHLFVFFRKIGNSTRAIIIKEQNNKFIEVILDNHNNYDNKRKYLGYKKSSYYKS